jgi:hypothetical protein
VGKGDEGRSGHGTGLPSLRSRSDAIVFADGCF